MILVVVCIDLSGEKEREREITQVRGGRWHQALELASLAFPQVGRGVPAQPEAPTKGVFGKRGEPQKYSNFFDLRILLVILSGTIEDFGLHHVLQCPNGWHGFHNQGGKTWISPANMCSYKNDGICPATFCELPIFCGRQ